MHQVRIISALAYPVSQAEVHFAWPASAYGLPSKAPWRKIQPRMAKLLVDSHNLPVSIDAPL
jgi:hypothetical protein